VGFGWNLAAKRKRWAAPGDKFMKRAWEINAGGQDGRPATYNHPARAACGISEAGFDDADLLLEQLRRVHGEPRYDIAGELMRRKLNAGQLKAFNREYARRLRRAQIVGRKFMGYGEACERFRAVSAAAASGKPVGDVLGAVFEQC
jgi:hypothetical protein